MANRTNILARYRREADTSSAEAGRNSAAVHRENIESGAEANGAAVDGMAVDGTVVTGAAAADSSLSVDLVTRITGVGTLLWAGAFLTHTRITAIILIAIILRIGTIMIITIAPYQEGTSLGLDPSPATTARLFNRGNICGRSSAGESNGFVNTWGFLRNKSGLPQR
jgi:hypothetical protein